LNAATLKGPFIDKKFCDDFAAMLSITNQKLKKVPMYEKSTRF
jgi:hypothetical protein